MQCINYGAHRACDGGRGIMRRESEAAEATKEP